MLFPVGDLGVGEENSKMKRTTNLIFALLLALSFTSATQTVINMERRGDAFYVPCKVNGLPLKMLFDTGAEKVCMSLSEAVFMVKNGYLLENDLGQTVYSRIANGDVVEGLEINIREIEIGGLKLHNVRATIINTLSAPLLLGQSAIQKLGPIQINGNKLTILNGMSQSANYYMKEASMYNEAENYEKAIESANKGISSTTDNYMLGGLYYELGHAYRGLGDDNKGIEALRKSMLYMPYSSTAYNLGVALFDNEQYSQAYSAFRQFFRLSEDEKNVTSFEKAGAYAYMAEIDYREGRLYEAESNAKNSLSIKPFSMSYYTLANIYVDNENYNKAIDYLEKGLSFAPNAPSNMKYYNKAGIICLYFGSDENIAKGVKYLKKTLSIFDNDESGITFINPEYSYSAYHSALLLAKYYVIINNKKNAKIYYDKALSIIKPMRAVLPETGDLELEKEISLQLNNK